MPRFSLSKHQYLIGRHLEMARLVSIHTHQIWGIRRLLERKLAADQKLTGTRTHLTEGDRTEGS
jgi:hypothetical protein